MELLIAVYRDSPWLIAFHLLMLGAMLYALIRMDRHPWPSTCVILAGLLDYGIFLIGLFVEGDNLFCRFVGHIQNGGWFLSSVLLYLAVFAWRRGEGHAHEYDRSFDPAGPEQYALPLDLKPVRVPVAWPVTATIMAILTLPLAFATGFTYAMVQERDSDRTMSIFLGLATATCILVHIVLVLKVLHRGWRAIQDEHAKTTPGKAVGYLFVPLFNLYWVFVAWAGLAKGLNAFARRYGLPIRRLPTGLFVLQCILVLASLGLKYVPVAGFVNNLAVSILFLVAAWKITGAVNEAHDYITQQQHAAEATPQSAARTAEHPETDYAPPGYYD